MVCFTPPAAESYCTNRRLSWRTVRTDKHTVLSGIQLATHLSHPIMGEDLAKVQKQCGNYKGQEHMFPHGRKAYLTQPKVHFPKGLNSCMRLCLNNSKPPNKGPAYMYNK